MFVYVQDPNGGPLCNPRRAVINNIKSMASKFGGAGKQLGGQRCTGEGGNRGLFQQLPPKNQALTKTGSGCERAPAAGSQGAARMGGTTLLQGAVRKLGVGARILDPRGPQGPLSGCFPPAPPLARGEPFPPLAGGRVGGRQRGQGGPCPCVLNPRGDDNPPGSH